MQATGKCLLSFQWKAWGSFLADSGFRMSCKGGQGRLRLKSKVIKWFLFQKTQPQATSLHMEEAVPVPWRPCPGVLRIKDYSSPKSFWPWLLCRNKMTFASHSEMILLGLLGDCKNQEGESHVSWPIPSLCQSDQTQYQHRRQGTRETQFPLLATSEMLHVPLYNFFQKQERWTDIWVSLYLM